MPYSESKECPPSVSHNLVSQFTSQEAKPEARQRRTGELYSRMGRREAGPAGGRRQGHGLPSVGPRGSPRNQQHHRASPLNARVAALVSQVRQRLWAPLPTLWVWPLPFHGKQSPERRGYLGEDTRAGALTRQGHNWAVQSGAVRAAQAGD